MRLKIFKHKLLFKHAAGTSRGVLKSKNTWFLKLYDAVFPEKSGIGEINMFEGLSYDDNPLFYNKLLELEAKPEFFIERLHEELKEFPSIRFGLEMALIDYHQKENHILFPSKFTKGEGGIPINGLIWMGEKDFMLQQIKVKLDSGFKCLKLKIGAIDFSTELNILKSIRQEFLLKDLELRVDANGAFSPSHALNKLNQLSKYQLHSIEQPIKQGHIEQMSSICSKTPLPIALDEELIGINNIIDKEKLLSSINPQYIILKPSLTGGFKASDEWIHIADKRNIGWWVTSALESNIGLNAIAQWTYKLQTNNYQGLGTGQLYTNNIESPLFIKGENLYMNPKVDWGKQIY